MPIYGRYLHQFPSLITTNVQGRRPIFREKGAATLFTEILRVTRDEAVFDLVAFVVMPDHVHLIIRPAPTDCIARIVQLIKGRFARRYNLENGSMGTVWQSRYHERALRGDKHLVAAIRYVHYNPVAAGLAAMPEGYRWSSACSRGVSLTSAAGLSG